MSLFRPSVRPHETTGLPLYEFSWIVILEGFSKIVSKIQVSLKCGKNNGHCIWRRMDNITISRWILRMRNISEKGWKEISKQTFYLQIFFPENHTMYEIIWRNSVASLATDYNRIRRMRFACWVFWGYRHAGYTNAPEWRVLVHSLTCLLRKERLKFKRTLNEVYSC